MIKPPSSVRLAGHPLVACCLLPLCGLLVYGWYRGAVPGLLAILAVITARQTLVLFARRREYLSWVKAWESLSPKEKAIWQGNSPAPQNEQPSPAAPARAKEARTFGDRFTLCAAALLVAVLPFCGTGTHSVTLTWVWLLACLYLVYRFGLRWSGKRHPVEARVYRTKQEDKPRTAIAVSWLLPAASVSPSRAMAEGALPDYCARMLDGVGKRGMA
ncbi:MAG TPA: hypothetical protein VFB14_24130 [Bryobacteraceae bacterium]|jgi:hypothetical protein|nr:hypothetical protein [Bryobacteraceae bacterium]